MAEDGVEFRSEIARIRSVADMLCTGHANLRDRYTRYSLVLDLSILALATWLSALAFVQPRINVSLSPFHIDPQIWSGSLAVATLFLSILQIKVDWKRLADAHGRTLDIYAEVKREAGYLLASGKVLDQESCGRVIARYDMASATGVGIPESEFLPQKRRHRIKVAISKHLDEHPASSIPLTFFKLWLRDNFK